MELKERGVVPSMELMIDAMAQLAIGCRRTEAEGDEKKNPKSCFPRFLKIFRKLRGSPLYLQFNTTLLLSYYRRQTDSLS
jgi:hypothetical protein